MRLIEDAERTKVLAGAPERGAERGLIGVNGRDGRAPTLHPSCGHRGTVVAATTKSRLDLVAGDPDRHLHTRLPHLARLDGLAPNEESRFDRLGVRGADVDFVVQPRRPSPVAEAVRAHVYRRAIPTALASF